MHTVASTAKMRRLFQFTTALLVTVVATCSKSSSASSSASSARRPPPPTATTTTTTTTSSRNDYSYNVPPPEISLHLKSSVGGGQALSFGTLVPNVKWGLSGSVADFDVEAGINLQVDVDHASRMQYSLWTKLKRSIRDMITVSARLDTTSHNSHLQNYGIHFNINAVEKTGTSVDFMARAHVNATIIRIGVSNLQLTQSMDALGGTWTVIPRYNVDRNQGDIKVGYGIEGASVGVHLAPNKSVLTLSKQLGENNRITPAVATNGEVELEYRRKLAFPTTATSSGSGSSRGGIVTTTFKPNAFVNIKYEEGPWIANLNAPMKGLSFHEGVKFNVRRTGL